MFHIFTKFVSVKEVLPAFTDYHSHLLPGVDDGIQKMADALQVLHLMEQQGVKEVYLTPHIMEDVPNRPEDLRQRFKELQEAYQGGITLHLAAEHMLDPLFEKRLQARDLLPLTPDGRLLVETSYFNPPMDMDGMLLRIREAGYTPVLAHPERYQYMDTERYGQLHEQGICYQLNLPSLVGAYGPEAQRKAQMLLKRGWYHLMGTDTHSMRFYQAFLHGKLPKKEAEGVRGIRG